MGLLLLIVGQGGLLDLWVSFKWEERIAKPLRYEGLDQVIISKAVRTANAMAPSNAMIGSTRPQTLLMVLCSLTN